MRNKILIKLLFISLLFFGVNVYADDLLYNLDDLVKENNINYENINYVEITSITNIDELKKYNKINKILIKDIQINDISFINSLTELKEITIYYSKINLKDFNNYNVNTVKILSSYIQDDDLKSLSNIDNLEVLNLDGSYIENIESVKYLKTLKELSVSSISNLKSLDVITNLKNLKIFNFSGSEELINEKVLSYMRKNNITGYLYDKSKYSLLDGNTYNNELNKIIESLELDGLNDIDKIKKITLYVLENMKYDDDCNTKKGCSNPNISFNRVLTSLSYKGVCYHYALLETKLLNKANIKAYLVSGYNESNIGHEWVNIYLDDKWYAIDPTWMDYNNIINSLKQTGNASYYMIDLSDKIEQEKFYKKHKADVIPSNIIDVNGKYIDKTEILKKDIDVYEIINVIFILFGFIFLIYTIRKFNKK